jgi:translation initiation factor 5A
MSRPVDAGSLKIGSNIIIEDVACKIVEIEHSKPGKHGSAKVRITAIGLFDGAKRNIVCPVDARVDVPLIEKKSGQVIALSGDDVQLMDLGTYEQLYAPMPTEEDIKAKLATGLEVEYWQVLGKLKIVRVKGS